MEKRVRFDDRLATVLARPADRPADRVAHWRQLLDLLAQRGADADPDPARAGFDRLVALRPEIPLAIRRETARTLAGRPVAAPLVAFLAADVPAVAGAILPHAKLDQQGWLAILPRLSPTGRGYLRHRRDLGPIVEAALASFGATDMQIGGDVAVPGIFAPSRVDRVTPSSGAASGDLPPLEQEVEHGVGEGQIRAIITRIARFRQDRTAGPPQSAIEAEDAAGFRFETGTDGVIRWLDGVPRGPLIGETIAVPASGPYGVDAQAPGAFRRRAPFRDARLIVAGDSTARGEWRIAGVPVFDAVSGRFEGYRCTARRPRAHERAEIAPEPAGDAYGGFAPDSLRQLVHELRTPLNAIGGFAEMIRRQMRGPISTAYRDRAGGIAEQAGRLLAAVDDLDVAARLATRRLDLQHVPVDLGAMVATVCSDHAQVAERRGAALICPAPIDSVSVTGDPAALRRMIARLVASCAALAGEAETIHVDLALNPADMIELSVGRPRQLVGKDEATLLDPGYGPEGDSPDAPLLGLGFSLHLVRRLAMSTGGTLTIEAERFLLRLPAAADPSRVSNGG